MEMHMAQICMENKLGDRNVPGVEEVSLPLTVL